MKVRDLMIENVVTTKENTTIKDAISILFKKHVGALMIIDDERKCKGIFTERDALRSVARKIPLNTSLRKVMSKNVVTISEDSSFAEAKRSMISSKHTTPSSSRQKRTFGGNIDVEENLG